MYTPDAKRAKKLVAVGASREAAGDMQGALTAYEEAALYAPFDVMIVSKGVALRAKLVQGYVNAAERLAIDGDMNGATHAMGMALQIDPSSSALQERLEQLAAMRGPGSSTDGLPPELPTEGLPVLQPQKVTHSFNLRATDVRNAYEQVATVYGIKVVFDPELPARNVRLRLNDTDFDTAMKVLTAQTGTFWRPVDKQLIFVSADTAEKRKAYDLEMEQTFPLSASLDATEIADLVRVVREMTGIQHIQPSIAAHTVSVRDTVQRVRLAGNIIRAVEQTRGELLLDFDFLEVNRDNALKLGITPPSNIRLIPLDTNLAQQVRSANSLTQLLTLVASVFGTVATGGGASLAALIPPFAAIGGGKSMFLLTMPTFTADFSQGLSTVQSGNQVLLRAQDGKPATFFVGERYPVTLSLLSSSLSTGPSASSGGSASTITQQQFTVGRGPVAMTSGTFQALGAQDLAVVNEIDNTLTILLNQGGTTNPQFVQAASSPIGLGDPRTTSPDIPPAIATGTFFTKTNSYADLLVSDPVANTVTLLLGNNDGSFVAQKPVIAVGKQPSSIAVGQFNTNKDANYGFVVTNFTDNTYSVFTGNGDGTFTQVSGSPFALATTETGPYAIAVGDFNADGKSDLAIVNETSNNVAILQGNGDGTFKEFTNSPVAVGRLPVAIASGVLSGSTGPGLIVVNQEDNDVSILLGDGTGTFLNSTQSPLVTGTTPSSVAIGSVGATNGFAVTNTADGTVTVYVDLGGGLFTPQLEPNAGASPGVILVGNFANTSDLDVAVTNNISGADGQVTLITGLASLIAGTDIAEQPYPGSEFIDLGLKVKATPSLNENHEVTLQLEVEIKALTGTSINGIPVLSNRNVTQTVRLREDQPSLVVGLLDNEETKSITGIPGLATLPGVGYAFGGRNNTLNDTELLVIVTPRRVRLPMRFPKPFMQVAAILAVAAPSAPMLRSRRLPSRPPRNPRASHPRLSQRPRRHSNRHRIRRRRRLRRSRLRSRNLNRISHNRIRRSSLLRNKQQKQTRRHLTNGEAHSYEDFFRG